MWASTCSNAMHSLNFVWGADDQCAYALHIPCSACVHVVIQWHVVAGMHRYGPHHMNTPYDPQLSTILDVQIVEQPNQWCCVVGGCGDAGRVWPTTV